MYFYFIVTFTLVLRRKLWISMLDHVITGMILYSIGPTYERSILLQWLPITAMSKSDFTIRAWPASCLLYYQQVRDGQNKYLVVLQYQHKIAIKVIVNSALGRRQLWLRWRRQGYCTCAADVARRCTQRRHTKSRGERGPSEKTRPLQHYILWSPHCRPLYIL